MKKTARFFISLFAFLLAGAPGAFAYEPKPAELLMQPPAGPNMERLVWFHDHFLLYIISSIVLFVFILLAIVVLRYNKHANPKPAQFTHNVAIEVMWTVVPVVILVIIAIPSFGLLTYLNHTEEPDMTLKISGYQWGWTYSYPDHGIEEYKADVILDPDDLDTYIPDGMGRRLLETYNPIVLPINQNIVFHITSDPTDVIHSWAVPALGVKKDAVPGRLNESWTRITDPGVYFGQCSEICGKNHAFMPISVYAVPEEEFVAWTECVTGDKADADYPARACVQVLGLDKYRKAQKKQHNYAQATGAE